MNWEEKDRCFFYIFTTLQANRLIIKDIFGEDTIDPELWDELDGMDDGQRIDVPLCVFDLKRIRSLVEEGQEIRQT